jgi:high-affinity nickel-transport protein
MPNDWLGLLALVFLLGLKHGFDADHLATIDGLTRFNSRDQPRLARYCGTLFSLGHGGVVLLVAIAVSSLAGGWTVPPWFEQLGAAISIAFLLALGALNLYAVFAAPAGELVRPVGFKGRLLGGLQRAGSPWLVAAVGALFALSFDTLSQAALFALTASRFGGWEHGLALGATFLLGMLLCDGANGLWISRLLQKTDRLACVASRVMGLSIAAIAFAVAGLGIARNLSPAFAAFTEGSEFGIGGAVIAAIAASFLLAARLSRGSVPVPLR